jgi:enoyl-CoA hydratase
MSRDVLDPPSLIVSIRDGGVAVVELNRPKKRNALSQALIDELTAALSQLDRSPTVRVIVLSGAEASPFCGTTIEITLVHFPRLTCVKQPGRT